MVFGRPLARRPLARMLGTAARTAVIAGTASAVTGAVRRRQARRAAPPPPPPETTWQQPAAPAGGLTDEQLNRLERLAGLRESGVLSTEEFEAQKAAILGTADTTG